MNKKFLTSLMAFMLVVPCVGLAGCGNPSENNSSSSSEPIENLGPSMDDYNTKEYWMEYGDFAYGACFKATELGDFKAARGWHIYEADQAILGGDAAIYGKDNDRVGYLTTNSTVTFSITADQDIDVFMVLNIATATDDWDGAPATDMMSITVNGQAADISDCWVYGTGLPESYTPNNMCEVALQEGENTIVIKALKDEVFYLDWMALTGKIDDINYASVNYTGEVLRMEAEEANGRIDACKIGYLDGFSGGKILEWTEPTTKVEFIVTVKETCTVNLKLQANFGGQVDMLDNRLNIDVNDNYLDLSGIAVDLHDVNGWWNYPEDIYDLGNITLQAGENRILISAIIGVFNIDYIEISPIA